MTQAFNLSQLANKVNSSGLLDVATGVTGTQPVANGGTGQSTYTDGQLLIGNTTGNTLTKATLTQGSGITITNGSGAITIAASGGGALKAEIFTAPGTWTKPASCTQANVTVIGGGGGGAEVNTIAQGGTGGTSSFGPAVSATGGSGSNRPPPGTIAAGSPGTGTVSSGTTIRAPFSFNVGDQKSFGNIDGIQGQSPSVTAQVFSISNPIMAGSGATTQGNAGAGGMAFANVPVSGPVAITVGAGGNGTHPSARGGIGGAILVEYVG